jgi:hypothetical protein
MPTEQEVIDHNKWLQHLLPLPQKINIDGQIECHPQEIGIRLASAAGPLEHQAVVELRQLFSERTGHEPNGDRFTFVVGIADAQNRLDDLPIDLSQLATVPNRSQAYIIQPAGADKMLVAALDGRGVYYGMRTLYQLLEPGLSAQSITVPLARVVDWPDMDERGLWNFPDEAEWIPWMAAMKLNYGKMAATHLAPVQRGQPNSATIDTKLLLDSQRQAFNYSPYILHLNFLHDCGLYQAYPELAGKGDSALTGRYFAHKQGNQHRAPCASQPVLVEILAEWMASIAAQQGYDISCWLSERPGQCGCTACTAVGQFVLEARAFVAAWKQTSQTYPDLQIRIFLSTTTLERDYRVLAELPSQVKIERACATGMERVPHLPRDLIANPLYDQYAAQGRWIASYDVPISANGLVDTPEFKVPERSAHRIQDFVEQLHRRGYQGAYGMIAWGTLAKQINGFNIAALAEWSWNRNGRDTRQFATAWATRQGLAQPDQVAAWAELMGPLEFDVFDSDFPVCYSQGKALELVRQRQRPYLGEGMFRYYPTPESFAKKQAVCTQALLVAQQLEDPDFAHETLVVYSYIGLAHGVWQVAELLATRNLEDPADQETMRLYLDQLRHAGNENTQALHTWRTNLGPQPWHYRVHDAISATEDTVREICRFVEEWYFF